MSIQAILDRSECPEYKASVAARYDRYVKLCVRNNGIPDDPDTWALREYTSVQNDPGESMPYSPPIEEHSFEERQRIRDAFLCIMVPEGHGEFADKARYGVLKIGRND